MRFLHTFALLGMLSLTLLGPAPQPATAQEPAAVVVGIYDNYFDPPTIFVAPGTTVWWVNYGAQAHSSSSTVGLWESGDLSPGDAYNQTFDRAGNYRYYDRTHMRNRMLGRVVVIGP